LEERVRQSLIGRVQRRNDWTLKQSAEHPNLYAFIGLDPRMGEEGMLAELEDCVREGARGIKIHCSTQRTFPNDDGLWAVYKRAEELEISVVNHSGWHPLSCHLSDYSRPARFEPILKDFPKLHLVLDHIGLGWEEEAIALAKAYPNVYFDSSLAISGTWTPMTLADDEIVNLLRAVGIDRVTYASDWPLCVPLKERERMEGLPLSDGERRQLFYQNAERIHRLG
jgi:predicted TIM-barrel fold metal-dependent hydrolase